MALKDSFLRLDGSNYAQVPDHADFEFGSGDFTYDFLVYFNSFPAFSPFATKLPVSGGEVDHQIMWDYKHSTTDLRVYLYAADDSNKSLIRHWAPEVDTWYHIAFVRASGTGYLFVDGVLLGTSGDMDIVCNDNDHPLQIGATTQSARFADVDIEELRISDTARWTSGFTPSATPYTSDGNTMLLCHFDEESEGTTPDASSSSHTVTLVNGAFIHPTAFIPTVAIF